MNIEEMEKIDKYKTKVLKYILYRKRTEHEVRQKFLKDIDKDLLEDIILELKENNYINDSEYIKSAVKEQMNLNTLSIKELKYKLLNKGLKSDVIENFFSENEEDMQEYELSSIKKIIERKSKSMDLEKEDEVEKLKIFLLRKGYKNKNIAQAIKER